MNLQDYRQQQTELNQKYIELCKKYSLNPSVLKEIIFHRSKGYNNTDIANRIGIHRVTVQHYVDKLKEMEDTEFGKALLAATAILAGAYILSNLLGDNS